MPTHQYTPHIYLTALLHPSKHTRHHDPPHYTHTSPVSSPPHPLHALLRVAAGADDEPNEVVPRVLLLRDAQLAVLLLWAVVGRRLEGGVDRQHLRDELLQGGGAGGVLRGWEGGQGGGQVVQVGDWGDEGVCWVEVRWRT
jgi:hypothetical protein